MCCDLSGAVLLHVPNNEGFDSAVATSGSALLLGSRFAGASSVFGWTKKGGKTFSYSGFVILVVGLGEGISRVSLSSRLTTEDRLLDTVLETSSGLPVGGTEGTFGLLKNVPIRICDYQQLAKEHTHP
jgi:hypothetical protein